MEYNDGVLRLLDQRALPNDVRFVECISVEDLARAIKDLTIRGAPALGIVAAYGLVMAAREGTEDPLGNLHHAASVLAATRPTAVNLFWALERMKKRASTLAGEGREYILKVLEEEARAIHLEDITMNKSIGAYGECLIKRGYGVLTHCNAGALATGGVGTALGVLRAAHESGTPFTAYVTETRPVLQGARLTAWETVQMGIPTVLITDNMAAHFMSGGHIDIVVVGADRIAANGDVANKIGTYGLAVLSRAHEIPFYVAAPTTTIDMSLRNGAEIEIEERHPEEVNTMGGQRIAPLEVMVRNPAFDITPGSYITGIITDQGVLNAPYDKSLMRAVRASGR